MILRLGTAKKRHLKMSHSLDQKKRISFRYRSEDIYRFYRFSVKPMSNYNIRLWYYKDGGIN